MNYKQTTQVPNQVLDVFLPTLTGAEFKILMIIIRQTHGWRKERDRMNYSQLTQKSGLSRRVIADVIQSLIDKKLITVTDYNKAVLNTPKLRKGKTSIYFSSMFYTYADKSNMVGIYKQKEMRKPSYNKTNLTKRTEQNSSFNQGTKKLSDTERYRQLMMNRNTNNS